MLQNQFADIILLIKGAWANSLKAVNAGLINLYWQIGEYISKQVANASWGDKTVDELALYIQKEHPELRGFNRRGLYRMKQFYETYLPAKPMLVMQFQSVENQYDVIVSAAGTQLEISNIKGTILTKLS